MHTNAMVIAEIVWTLGSFYELTRDEIKSNVEALLNTLGLVVENAGLIRDAIALHVERNINYIDAYCVVWMKQHGLARAFTFDVRHFSRVDGIHPMIPTGDT